MKRQFLTSVQASAVFALASLGLIEPAHAYEIRVNGAAATFLADGTVPQDSYDVTSDTSTTLSDTAVGGASSAFSSSNLATGELKVQTVAPFDLFVLSGSANALAQMVDTFTFSAPGLAVGDTLQIGVISHLNGTYDAVTFDGLPEPLVEYDLGFTSVGSRPGETNGLDASVQYTTGPDVVGSSFTSTNPDVFTTLAEVGNWSQFGPELFTGSFDIYSGDSTVSFVSSLFAQGNADFSHTASVAFVVPEGVTFTSTSGVSLTQTGGGSTKVPEPATLGLLATGLVVLGTIRRTRTRR